MSCNPPPQAKPRATEFKLSFNNPRTTEVQALPFDKGTPLFHAPRTATGPNNGGGRGQMTSLNPSRDPKGLRLESDPSCERVHLLSPPSREYLATLFRRMPRLKVVQLIPPIFERFSKNRRQEIEERGITLQSGYTNPGMAWREGENRRISNDFDKKQGFFENLRGEPKRKLDMLIESGSHEVEMCLAFHGVLGRPQQSQPSLAKKYDTDVGVVWTKIHAVIRLLDPEYEVASNVMTIVKRLECIAAGLPTPKRGRPSRFIQQQSVAV